MNELVNMLATGYQRMLEYRSLQMPVKAKPFGGKMQYAACLLRSPCMCYKMNATQGGKISEGLSSLLTYPNLRLNQPMPKSAQLFIQLLKYLPSQQPVLAT